MAKVTIVPGKTETIIKVITEQKVTLELSEKEAVVLKYVLGRISGCPRYSARKYTDDMWTELCKIKTDFNMRGTTDSLDLGGIDLDLNKKR